MTTLSHLNRDYNPISITSIIWGNLMTTLSHLTRDYDTIAPWQGGQGEGPSCGTQPLPIGPRPLIKQATHMLTPD
jgi:hypothetical protein